MKRIFALVIASLFVVALCSCSDGSEKVVGKWIDTATEQTFEYTSDGNYKELANENYTTDKTLYKVNGNKITYYIEDVPESEYTVSFRMEKGNLVIYEIDGNALSENIVYRPYTEQKSEVE